MSNATTMTTGARPRKSVARPGETMARPRPILVTGSHRSGSTWIGTVLALNPGSGYIPEPFNRRCRPGVCRADFPLNYTYLPPETAADCRPALADTLAWRYSLRAQYARVKSLRDFGRMVRDYSYFELMRRRGARPIMKDPIALFSAEWLATTFDMQVVAIIRHPAAFTASLRAAGWGRFPFWMLRDQPRLLEEQLAPFADAITAAAAVQPDEIDTGILLWRIFHHQIAQYQARHPDWVFIRHEDVSRDPQAGFRRLFADLGLDFTPGVADELARLSSGRSEDGLGQRLRDWAQIRNPQRVLRDSKTNTKSWKSRLTEDEIARIRKGTADLADRYYSDADW